MNKYGSKRQRRIFNVHTYVLCIPYTQIRYIYLLLDDMDLFVFEFRWRLLTMKNENPDYSINEALLSAKTFSIFASNWEKLIDSQINSENMCSRIDYEFLCDILMLVVFIFETQTTECSRNELVVNNWQEHRQRKAFIELISLNLFDKKTGQPISHDMALVVVGSG